MGLVERALQREGAQSFSGFWLEKTLRQRNENRLHLPHRCLTFASAPHPPPAPAPFPFLLLAAVSPLDPSSHPPR